MNLLLSFTEKVYIFLDFLIKIVHEFASFQEYAVIKQRIKTNKKNFIRKTVLKCDRGEKYQVEKFEKRLHFTFKKIECQFHAVVILNHDDDM